MKKRFSFFLFVLMIVLVAGLVTSADSSQKEIAEEKKEKLFSQIPQEAISAEMLDSLGIVAKMQKTDYDLTMFKSEYKGLPYLYSQPAFYDLKSTFSNYTEQIAASKDKFYLMLGTESVQAYSYSISEDQKYKVIYGTTLIPQITESLIKELRSIEPYMIFNGEICEVTGVLPMTDEFGAWAVYYNTDKGVFIKYLGNPQTWKNLPKSNDKALLFTEAEYADYRQKAFGKKIENNQKYFEEHGVYPIGSSTADLIDTLVGAGQELKFCEPGNPVPEHLQAELNTLLGVEPPVSTEGPDTDVPTGITTTDTTTTDIPTSENPASTDDGSVATDREIPWLWIGIGAGALVVVALAIILLTKKKK